MAKCPRNFVSHGVKREVGFHSHLQTPLDDFLMLAEDKAAIRDGQESTCKLPGCTRSTFLMVFSPDGTKVASTHGDHKIYVTEIKSGKCLHTLEGHPRTPWCIAFHPTSNDILASGCLGGEVRIWDFHGGSELWVAQQNSVIASLAFHPFAQTLVIATRNELFFWDWSKSQPYAQCKTASEREKVRYVKFDPLGQKLITGIANLPIVQSSMPDGMRSIANRYAMLRERYNRMVDVRREWQRFQTASAQNNVGTDPVAANERPTSPTQAEALQSAREYAQQETANANQSNSSSLDPRSSLHAAEYFERDSWRYRDPYSVPNTSNASASTVPQGSGNAAASASLSSSSMSFQQEFINTFNSRLRESLNINVENSSSNQPSEMSLPSSLIQALVRIQRTLELLEPRMNSVADRRNAEQSQLRQRIEEVLNRLFNLYASITPLRLLMDEMFQDFDREIVLAEVSRDGANSGTSQAGIAVQLHELRQQLARLLERIFSTEIELQGTAQAHVMQLRRNVRTNTASQSSRSTSVLPSEIRSTLEEQDRPSASGFASYSGSTPTDPRLAGHRKRYLDACNRDEAGPSGFRAQTMERKLPKSSHDFGSTSSAGAGASDGSSSTYSSSSIGPQSSVTIQERESGTGSSSASSAMGSSPSGDWRRYHIYCNSNQPEYMGSRTRLVEHRYSRDSPDRATMSRVGLETADRNPSAANSFNEHQPNDSMQWYDTASSHTSSSAEPSSVPLEVDPSSSGSNQEYANNDSLRTRRNLSIPRLQIDHAESLDDDNVPPVMRPRSPPVGSILQNEGSSSQQHFVDYQAASGSGMRQSSRLTSRSPYLHPNYFASLFQESLQRTSALQLVINRAIAGTFLGNSDFAVVNNVMSLTHRIQCWDFSTLQFPHISDAQANVVVPECKIHNDASVDISSDGHLLATLVPGTISLASTTVVGIYSLEGKTFGSCLYSYYFGPNAISVSLSPLSRYIVVGLASRRTSVALNEKQVVAQIFRVLAPKINGQENLMLIRNIEQRGTSRAHVSLNSIRWLPHPGEGLIYGTNRGELRISRPGPSREDEYRSYQEKRRRKCRNLLSRLNGVDEVQSAATQTVAPQTQSAGTQTGYDHVTES